MVSEQPWFRRLTALQCSETKLFWLLTGAHCARCAAQPAPAPPLSLDLSDMRSFLMKPGARERPVQCYIVRDRTSAKMYPCYTLYMQDNDRFMLSARKRKKVRGAGRVGWGGYPGRNLRCGVTSLRPRL